MIEGVAVGDAAVVHEVPVERLRGGAVRLGEGLDAGLVLLVLLLLLERPGEGLDPLGGHAQFSPSSLVLDVVELFDPFREEAPGPPELVELLLALGVERVHLAWRPLLGRNLLHVDEAALLDPDEQGVDGALDDVGEALLREAAR